MRVARKIVYVTDSDSFGGAEQMMLTLLSLLDRRRWQPVLVHYTSAGLAPLLAGARRLGVRTEALPHCGAAARVWRFAGLLRAEQPAVVHAHLNWPLACRYELAAAALARIPGVIATEHLFQDIPWRRSRIVQRMICARVDRYIAVSYHLARQLRDRLRFPARTIQVIHNGVALEAFCRPAAPALRAALAGEAGRPLILTAARLDKQKGQRYLLEALVAVPEAVAVLAGDGPDRALLDRQACELGLRDRVVFLGQRDDIPNILACCDVVVLPSLFEGLPLAVLEAMAATKPVIATDVGGTGEAVLHGRTGLLVPPASPMALASAIQSVLGDPSLARRLADAGLARVRQEFSAEIMTARVMELYDQILDAKYV
jgi:glycosyltransferase involved in cell wall biosynthesis